MTRPARTGRGDPQGSSIQHGAGCPMSLPMAALMTAVAMWRHRHELWAEFLTEYRGLR